MRFLVVGQIARIVKGLITDVAFVGFHAVVPVEVRVERLAACELFAAHFANVLSLVDVRLGVTVAVAQTGERLAANGALKSGDFFFIMCYNESSVCNIT